jgi:hypothetical protein
VEELVEDVHQAILAQAELLYLPVRVLDDVRVLRDYGFALFLNQRVPTKGGKVPTLKRALPYGDYGIVQMLVGEEKGIRVKVE